MNANILDYFTDFSIIQVLDISLVLLLIFQLYRAFRGSIAFNIFIGALVIYGLWIIVNKLQMPLMSEIMDRLVSIGLISMIVVFQPEIRKFLIMLGKKAPFGKSGSLAKFFQANALNKYIIEEDVIEEISQALIRLQQKNCGAILVIARSDRFEFDTNTGSMINGAVSSKMLESIFSKNSPLHDGAVLIEKDNLIAAGIVLPVSDSHDLPSNIGLRHRAGVGASEHSDVLVVILSEESNKFSLAMQGKLLPEVSIEQVKKEMFNAMTM